MRTIDVFVSAASDVQKETAIAEQLIRSVAAEFDLQVSVSYSNPLRGSKEDAAVEPKDADDESTQVLRSFFWDFPALERNEVPEHAQTPYDLVICLLWSRFANVPVGKCALANGNSPWSAIDYNIDWILGRSDQISEFQKLLVYRNGATPDALLEPKEEREEMCQQWDALQDFFAKWEKDDEIGFRECCHEYLDLEEFGNLLRQHFRDFLVERLNRGIQPNKAQLQSRFRGSNPFRGLKFFDFEHAAFYHGRTRAVGEVLDALKKQATAKKSFVLVFGPSGSGKSSLVRSGVLPLLTQGGTPVGNGPWRHVITRPGVGDPIDSLAAALVAKFAVPELQDVAGSDESLNLASRLRQDPENAAVRIAEVLGKPKLRLALVVDQLEELFIGVSPVLQRKYVTVLCALARYEGIYVIAALRSEFYAHYQRFPELVKLTSGGGRYELQPPTAHEIANMIRVPAEAAGLRFEQDSETGRSLDDYLLKAAMNSSEPLPLLEHVLSRLYNRQLDRKDGLLRWADYSQLGGFKNALAQHAELVFLRLNRDEQHAFEFLIRQLLARGAGKENVFIRRPVPYHDLVSSPKFNHRQSEGLEHLLDKAEIVRSQPGTNAARAFQAALRDYWKPLKVLSQKKATKPKKLKQTIAGPPGWREWLRRHYPIAATPNSFSELQELVPDIAAQCSKDLKKLSADNSVKQLPEPAPSKLSLKEMVEDSAAARSLIDCLSAEGLLSVDTDSKHCRLISLPQDALLNNWPRLLLSLSEDEHFFGMRDRLDESLRLWLSRGLQSDHLLHDRIALAEAETLLRDFGSALSGDQIDYIRKSLARQERPGRRRNYLGLAAIILFAVFAVILIAERFNSASQLSALQVQLKQEQDKAQKAQADADFLISQRDALQNQLKQAEEKSKQALANSADAASQLSALQGQLKQDQEKEQKAQVNADSLIRERNALKDQLKQAEATAQLTQQRADLAGSERNALQSQLKQAEEKAQQNTDVASSQRNELETRREKAQEDVQPAQKYLNLDPSQHKSGQTQPLNPGQNSEPATSPHPLDFSVLSAHP